LLPGVEFSAIQTKEQKAASVKPLPLRLRYLQPGTALMTIERFFIPNEEQDFYAFIDSVFLDLKERNVENLIIDVRNNEGGEESFGGYLYSYLSTGDFQYYKKITVAQKEPVTFLEHAWMPPPYEEERKKFVEKDGEVLWLGQPYLSLKPAQRNAFRGKVFILVNGFSFSVTSEFAAVVHHHKRATFIGEETGGAYYGNNSGVFSIVHLPNTKLGIGIPLLGFYSNVSGYSHVDRGIIPHHEVKRTVDELINGKDAVLEFTLGLISKPGINVRP
jgi:C-terminal processing protease CtpA/Prc